VTLVIVRERRLFDPRERFAIDGAKALDGVGGSERLVVVHHDRHALAARRAHLADHFQVLGGRRVTDLGLHAREAALRPFRCARGAFGGASVPHRSVGRDGPLHSAQQSGDRDIVHTSKRVPHRHVDSGERHADQALRAEQAESAGQFAREFGGGERRALHKSGHVDDQVAGGFEGCRGVGEGDAVARNALVGEDVGKYERRFGNGAAGSPVRLHRNADRAHAKPRDLRTTHRSYR
jgi:hypothetical protein